MNTNKTLTLTDNVKTALVPLTNNNKFRRGLWCVNTLLEKQKQGLEGVPAIPEGASHIFYRGGCIVFYIKDKTIYKNTHATIDEVSQAVIDNFTIKNKCEVIDDNTLSGAVRGGGAKKDYEALFTL